MSKAVMKKHPTMVAIRAEDPFYVELYTEGNPKGLPAGYPKKVQPAHEGEACPDGFQPMTRAEVEALKESFADQIATWREAREAEKEQEDG